MADHGLDNGDDFGNKLMATPAQKILILLSSGSAIVKDGKWRRFERLSAMVDCLLMMRFGREAPLSRLGMLSILDERRSEERRG